MTLSALGELLLLGAIWGASFLFIKIGVSDIRPLTFATLRVLVGSVVLLGVIALKRLPLLRGKRLWGRLAVMGAVGIVIPFGAIAWGTQYIASGLSAILNATMPLFTFGLAVLLGDEPLSLRRVLGLVVGFLGIMVLTWPKLQAGIRSEVWGQVAVIAASLSYAAAILYAKRYLAQEPPLLTAFGQVSMGCALLVPLALAELPWQQTFTPRVIGSVLAIGVIGTAMAYILYYRLLREIGPTATSLVTYIVPLFGIFWGRIILAEILSWHAFVALALIFLSLILVNGLPQTRRSR